MDNGIWHNKAYVQDDNGLYITGYSGHSSDEFNDQWLHCILIEALVSTATNRAVPNYGLMPAVNALSLYPAAGRVQKWYNFPIQTAHKLKHERKLHCTGTIIMDIRIQL